MVMTFLVHSEYTGEWKIIGDGCFYLLFSFLLLLLYTCTPAAICSTCIPVADHHTYILHHDAGSCTYSWASVAANNNGWHVWFIGEEIDHARCCGLAGEVGKGDEAAEIRPPRLTD